jgi:hypothetical protein
VPLAQLAQLDYSAGMWRSVARNLIPENGAWDILNGLLDEDGSVYRRGGPQYLSTGAFGSSLRFLWDGFLVPGRRTLIASTAAYGVLDASEAPLSLGGTGMSAPKRAVEVAGMLFIGGGQMYGGSRKTADYTTGTVSVTNGSKTVTGSGVTWNTLVDSGMLLRIGSGRYYVVESFDSTTQLTLRDAYEGTTASGQVYALSRLGTAPRVSDIYAVAANRLFSLEGSKAYFSAVLKPQSFTPTTDVHTLPGGANAVGAAPIGNELLIFTTNGLWLLAGIEQDIVDEVGNPQHQLRQVNPELLLLSHEGIANYRGAVVAPCADGIWLVDGVSTPELLTRSITQLWRYYVAQGYRTGLATVSRSHYYLPILDPVAGGVEDVLVCRLDRPTGSPIGTAYPWTHMDGYVRKLGNFAVRSGGSDAARKPELIATSTGSDARVAKCSSFFEPTAAVKNDPDGSTHLLDITYRDIPTADGFSQNTVRRVRLRYELEDAASDNPTIRGYYRSEESPPPGSEWGAFEWGAGEWSAIPEDVFLGMTNPGDAPEDKGDHPFVWHINKHLRFFRPRFKSSGPAAKLKLRSMELFIRQGTRA